MGTTLRLIEEESALLELIMEKMDCKTKNGAIRKMISEYLDKEREIEDLNWKVEQLQTSVNILTKKQQDFVSAFEDLKLF